MLFAHARKCDFFSTARFPKTLRFQKQTYYDHPYKKGGVNSRNIIITMTGQVRSVNESMTEIPDFYLVCTPSHQVKEVEVVVFLQ